MNKLKLKKEDSKLIAMFITAMKDMEEQYLKAIRTKKPELAKVYAEKAKKIVDLLKYDYKNWEITRFMEEYMNWYDDVNKIAPWERINEYKNPNDFFKANPLHKKAALTLLNSSTSAVYATLDWVKKDITYSMALFQNRNRVVDVTQEIQVKLASWVLTWKWLSEQKKDIVRFFQERWMVLRDKSWRKRDPKTYAEMLIRTETTRAYNAWTLNRSLELWITKFRIDEAADCCSICSEFSWKVVDVKDWMIELPPYHPNCRGSVTPIITDKKPSLEEK